MQHSAHTHVTLSRGADGKALATLAPCMDTSNALSALLAAEPDWLLWSPDGTRLLLLDAPAGTLSIWQPSALPR